MGEMGEPCTGCLLTRTRATVQDVHINDTITIGGENEPADGEIDSQLLRSLNLQCNISKNL